MGNDSCKEDRRNVPLVFFVALKDKKQIFVYILDIFKILEYYVKRI